MVLLIAVFSLLSLHLVTKYRAFSLGVDSIIVLGSFDFNFGYWFDIDTERRFAAVFSTLLILVASGTMLHASIRVLPKKGMAIGWLFMSGVLLFMACDEFFSIHEHAGKFFGTEVQGEHIVPGWVKAMAGVVAVLCIPMGFFWWKLPTYMRVRTAIAAGVFLLGAMGVEVPAMNYATHYGTQNVGYALFGALEEGMEMIGMVIAISAMFLYHTNTLGKDSSAS